MDRLGNIVAYSGIFVNLVVLYWRDDRVQKAILKSKRRLRIDKRVAFKKSYNCYYVGESGKNRPPSLAAASNLQKPARRHIHTHTGPPPPL